MNYKTAEKIFQTTWWLLVSLIICATLVDRGAIAGFTLMLWIFLAYNQGYYVAKAKMDNKALNREIEIQKTLAALYARTRPHP